MLMPLDQALGVLLQNVTLLQNERVTLDACDGRVLADPCVAASNLPAFDHSAMDGYALHTDSCTGDGPWTLTVAGESAAGAPLSTLTPGCACRIFTGAQLPAGANCVLMQENAQREGDHIRFSQRPSPRQHVRSAGADIRAGTTAITAGTRLDPGHVGLLGALDHAFLVVKRRPRVTLVNTGNELRYPGSAGAPGSIAESNSFALAALCRRLGATPRVLPYVLDTPEATRAALDEALANSDMVITVGGASVGDHDLVKPTLSACGVTWAFKKVAIKPGKPVALGRHGTTSVLCLPGNPASALVTFSLFAAPLLRAMHGRPEPFAPRQRMPIEGDRTRRVGRTELMRASLGWRHGQPYARLLERQSSGAVTAFARADALVVVPAEVARISSGDVLEVLRLQDAWW